MATYSDCLVLQQDICVKRSDRRTQRFKLLFNGTAVSVTGLTAKLTVSPNKTPDDETEQLFEIAGVPAAIPADGYFDFTPSAPQALQVPDVYFYDVQVTDSFGKPVTIAEGKWTVEADITDAGL
jgi:hypothetical protein